MEQNGRNADIRGLSMGITGVSSLPPPSERPLYVLLRFVFLASSSIFLACVFMSYVWFLLKQQKAAQGWGFVCE